MNRILTAVFATCTALTLHAQAPTLDWAESFGGSVGDWGYSVAVDPSGNAVSTGYFIGAVDFDPGPGTYFLGGSSGNQPDAYVQKVNSSGQLVWARSFGGTSAEIGYGIETDAAGAVYIVGQFAGTTDFDPGAGTHNVTASGGDIFILKLDANGNFRWVNTFSSTGGSNDAAVSIAAGVQNTMVIAGTINGDCDFDPGPGSYMINNTTTSGENIFVLCLDTAGQFVWACGIGGTGWEESCEVKCDVAGNVYLTGMFDDTVDFDPGAGIFSLSPQAADPNIYVLKLDASGNFVYAKVFLGNDLSEGFGITCTASGEAVVTGAFWGTIDFDPGAGAYNLTAVSLNDLFICKLDAAGNFVWALQITGQGNQIGRAMTTDAAGNFYVAGDFVGTVDFDPGAGTQTLTCTGSGSDVFILKLNSNGNFVWVTQLHSANSDYCFSIKTDAANAVYTTGWYSGAADFDPTTGIFTLTPNATDAFVQKYAQQCAADTSAIAATACSFYTLNNQTYTTSGNYQQMLTNVNGCDSVIQLNLTIDTVDVSVTSNDPVLTANAVNATYTWVSCETFFPAPNGNGQSFTPALNGSYAVIITQGNCTDTSACYPVIGLSAREISASPEIIISPNPSDGTFVLQVASAGDVMIYDAQGKLVSTQQVNGNNVQITLAEPGMYLVAVITAEGKQISQRVIVTE